LNKATADIAYARARRITVGIDYLKNNRRHMNPVKHDFPLEYFSESAVAIFIITPDHEVIFWNKACSILTGKMSSEMINTKNHWSPFYKQYRPCLVDVIIDGDYSVLPELYVKYKKSTLSPEGICAEAWYDNLGGIRRYISFDAVPIYNSSGKIIAAIETIHDLTHILQNEEAAERLISELKNTISKMSLKGFVPICSYCKKVRDKEGIWTAIDVYFRREKDLLFSDGICPHCTKIYFPDAYNKLELK
jgi:hypothetical protein